MDINDCNNIDLRIIAEEQSISPEGSPRYSSVDYERPEMMWQNKQEMYIKKIKLDAKVKSHKHKLTGKRQNKLYTILSLPPIILPIIMSGLTNISRDYPMINTFCFITVGVLSALNSFLNYGKKSQENYQFESKYSELVSDINLEMTKPKRFRIPVDVFLERLTVKFNHLNKDEPLTTSLSKEIDMNTFKTPYQVNRKI